MKAILALLWLYQAVGRLLLPPCCRFTPSCSDYARQALLTHGLNRGLLLGAKRLWRCRPLGPAGWDPVPLR